MGTAFAASRAVAQQIMGEPIMELKTISRDITSVKFDLQIDQSDMQFFAEVNRRMGNIALMKVLRMKYPFLGIAQASDLAKSLRDTFGD